MMDDDITDYSNVDDSFQENVDISGLLAAFYCWQKNPFSKRGEHYEDINWKRLYERIGVTNVILGKIDEFAEEIYQMKGVQIE